MAFFESIWQWILDLFGSFDQFLKETINYDQLVLDFYQNVVAPLPEWMKILGTLALVVVLVFGIFSIAKKLLKLAIFLAVVLLIIVLARTLLT